MKANKEIRRMFRGYLKLLVPAPGQGDGEDGVFTEWRHPAPQGESAGSDESQINIDGVERQLDDHDDDDPVFDLLAEETADSANSEPKPFRSASTEPEISELIPGVVLFLAIVFALMFWYEHSVTYSRFDSLIGGKPGISDSIMDSTVLKKNDPNSFYSVH